MCIPICLIHIYSYIHIYYRWLNKQIKRVLISDTRPVLCLYNFQVWLQFGFTIITYLFDVVYATMTSDIYEHVLNLIEEIFFFQRLGSYVCCYLLVSFIQRRFKLFIKICFISYLQIFLSSRIAKNRIIIKFLPPHVLYDPQHLFVVVRVVEYVAYRYLIYLVFNLFNISLSNVD